MSSTAFHIQDKKHTAQLAAHFNEFYLQITSPKLTQIGTYRIIREIGEGSFGKVYLAEHVFLHSYVVLKCGLLEDPNIVREIYYHKQLSHRNIVKLYEVIKTENHLWLAMEYCEGGELFYYIYEKRRLDMETTRKIFFQIVEGIRHVHSLNLAHRDLKLENILLADDKKTIIKLTDFGFVREFNPYKRTFLSTVCGTTAYMAPEMLKAEKYSGFAIDIWSMGVILYAMIYGRLPFDEDDEMVTKFKIINDEPEYRDNVPSEVNQLLQKMLSKDPAKRPSIPEILNSTFLIDETTMRIHKRNSVLSDTDSVISINQYYKRNNVPFQSKLEKDLLKKMQKSNIDIRTLKESKLSGQNDALTAFYELSLKAELERKKYRHSKKKRYYEAKRQLRRSRSRVKSVLSLSDQLGTPSQPLERILTSLSVSSKQDSYFASTSMARGQSEFTKPTSDSQSLKFVTDGSQTPTARPTPLERSVSFYPDERESSFTSNTQSTASRARGKNILGKLQFWKRNNKDTESKLSAHSSNIYKPSDEGSIGQDSGVLEINVGSQPINERSSDTVAESPKFSQNEPAILSDDKKQESDAPILHSQPDSHMTSSTSSDTYNRRHRPESVISQVSQLSQMSQMSQMSQLYPMSESDYLDGTDMEDEYYDDDGIYESSINTSHNDLHQRSTSFSSAPRTKKRPSNPRLPSDTSTLSSSTTATRRKNNLSQVSSNSSDESSSRSRLIDLSEDSPYEMRNTSSNDSRPISPRQKVNRTSNSRLLRTSPSNKMQRNGHLAAPAPLTPNSNNGAIVRPHSPPVSKTFSKATLNGAIQPLHKSFTKNKNHGNAKFGASNGNKAEGDGASWKQELQPRAGSLRNFEQKSIIQEEEDEED